MKFFYIRVSTKEQNEGRQLEVAKDMGVDEKCIFVDKESGKNLERPEWEKLSNILRMGDTLIVQDLSRLSRNKKDIKDVWKDLTDRGVNIEVVNMPILNTQRYESLGSMGQLVSDIVFELLSWMVEEERNRIKTNQKQGIELAKEQGKYLGRPVKYHKDATGADKLVYDAVVEGLEKDEPIQKIANKVGISKNTVYKINKQLIT
ncbi:recombinase family protein [Vagococcus sp. CY53-2]|uniref:recombinase family protein n=1 Tax=Vagococcus sp. CY53-2 TaxID=2925780 RepID=UPI001F514122|nr:recombinase family protein [Vagococcus sp. CY53-2]